MTFQTAVVLVGTLVAGLGVGGCATNVPVSRERQVEQVTETGPYSYERAVDPMGPGR